jgi:hypothetical protein
MKESIRDLTDKLSGHDDSLFDINTNVSKMKLGLDSTNTSLDETKKD